MDKLILLERKRPEEYEIHKGSIAQTRNLILTTKDKEYAQRIVKGFNNYGSLKVYKCTIVADNSCYLETLLVTANSKKEAQELIQKNQKRKVTYKRPLELVKINTSKPTVLNFFGWGPNDDNRYSNDD